eukprot:CAMPEP_0181341650 /NCGR_PEP_ID=MMETSP1101-20121128/30538_1 /TAXON_ID=46948 /ORGANISM="Rhodomonas abbreviata, Strain Caron Lab Isolate" /LENGTH=42 /DNA_ID= /DNA_START= /DNA_END= /DNA_ORIENTATION=
MTPPAVAVPTLGNPGPAVLARPAWLVPCAPLAVRVLASPPAV